MKTSAITRLIAAGAIALTTSLSFGGASAAIPCLDLPVIEPDPNMVIPMIYLELPRSIDDALGRGQPADRDDSVPLEQGDRGSVISAAENQMRCLGYGDDITFAGNSTPEQRVSMFAIPQIDSDESGAMIVFEDVYLERLGDPIQLADGRYLIDFGIVVDGGRYLTGEFVFEENDGELYLDGSTVSDTIELNAEPIQVDISLESTREVKIIEASFADKIVFNNLETDASAKLTITDADGETIWEGSAMGNELVGGADMDQFVVGHMPVGEYNVDIQFDDEDAIRYSMTLVVDGSGAATPVASPEATPAN